LGLRVGGHDPAMMTYKVLKNLILGGCQNTSVTPCTASSEKV